MRSAMGNRLAGPGRRRMAVVAGVIFALTTGLARTSSVPGTQTTAVGPRAAWSAESIASIGGTLLAPPDAHSSTTARRAPAVLPHIESSQPVVGMAATPDGNGYWLVASDGGVFAFGDAPFYGSLAGTGMQVLGVVVSDDCSYSEIDANGDAYPFGPSPADTSWASGGTGVVPAITPSAVPDSTLDTVLSTQLGPGWIGGDGAYSTTLPDGRIAFTFSDTFIGRAQPDGQAQFTGMVESSELVGTPPNLQSDYAGTYESPQSLIPNPGPDGENWELGATYVENGEQLVFVNEDGPVSRSPFQQFLGESGIAVLSATLGPLPTYDTVVALPTDPDTQWGYALLQSGGYLYVYGTVTDAATGTFEGMKIARFVPGWCLETDAWQYWTGSGWALGEANAVPVTTGNPLTGVVQEPGSASYVAVSTAPNVYADDTVDLSFASSPTGPWTSPQPVYSIPEVGQYQDEIAYFPTFHQELSSGNVLVVSYSLDTTDGPSSLAQDIHQYQPRFIDVSG